MLWGLDASSMDIHKESSDIKHEHTQQFDSLYLNPAVKMSPISLCHAVQNRGRLAEKRTIPLPPNRVPKKELSSIFSSDDSEGSERASGDHAHIKQEEESHYSILRKR